MTDSANAVPKPGSPEAIGKGCTCPVIDNHYGEGRPFGVGRVWVIIRGCTVHAPLPTSHLSPGGGANWLHSVGHGYLGDD